MTFAGTEFTTSGLINGDTVSSVTLDQRRGGGHGNGGRLALHIVASSAVGTGLGNYTITYQAGKLSVDPKALGVTADDRTKTYGDAVTFAGTEFTTSGLINGDTVSSVTLTSAGAAATATVAGSPYDIVASSAVGTGLGNYTITYQAGKLSVDPKALGVTADDRTKTYGDAVTFAGTEFTTSGLINGDTVSSVTLTSAGAAATATVAGWPYDIVASGAVGTGLGNYTITYQAGKLSVDPKALGVTADDRTKTYGDAVTFAGTEFTTSGLINGDTVSSVTLDQRRGGGHGNGGRLALRHRGQQRGGDGAWQLHDHLPGRQAVGRSEGVGGDRGRPDEDLRRRGDLRGHGVYHQRTD